MFDAWQVAGTGFALVIPSRKVLLPSLALAATLLLGAIVIAWIYRWRKRRDSWYQEPEADLEIFHSLHEQGQLSREELDRIRARLGSRVEPEPPTTSPPPPPSGKTEL
jgi:hypothetical protein